MRYLIEIGVLSLGGALGVNARHALGVWVSTRISSSFPWATLAINVTGSFLIGFLSVSLAAKLPHPYIRLLLVTGFLGGYTTFSTFSMESLALWEAGRRIAAPTYVSAAVLAGLLAVWMGVGLARVTVANPSARIDTPEAVEREL